MSARSKARKRAVDVLYEADVRGVPATGVLATQRGGTRPLNPYTVELVEGVVEQQGRIDGLLGEFAEGWTVARMPAVDRNILRIGVWELLCSPDVPDEVAISEAVALAESLSGDDAPAFVNGLLARISATTTA